MYPQSMQFVGVLWARHFLNFHLCTGVLLEFRQWHAENALIFVKHAGFLF